MEGPDSARADTRRFFMVAALAVLVGLVAPTGVEAAKSSKVTIKNPFLTTRAQDTTGDAIEAEAIPPMGTTAIPGSDGALAVRAYAGGGGFIGAIDCDTASPPSDSITIATDATGNEVVTALIATNASGTTANFALSAGGPLAPLGTLLSINLPPDDFASVELATGLTIHAAPVTIACTTPGAGNGGDLAVLGR